MATEPVTPANDLEDIESCELIDGRLIRKPSVGRRKHSKLELVTLALLTPFARKMGAEVAHEWTMLNGKDKLLPDVTFSCPTYEESDGYLVAPAFLVVETSSKDQSLSSLFKKCRNKYHAYGTPYCWVIDSEDEVGYECHKQDNGLFRLVDVLTAGEEIQVPGSAIFDELREQLPTA